MYSYRMIGYNPNYPTEVNMYDPDFDDNLPEWLTNNLKPQGIEDDIIKFKIHESSDLREYYLDTGGKLVVPKGKVILESPRGLSIIDREAFDVLYEKKYKIGFVRRIIDMIKRGI